MDRFAASYEYINGKCYVDGVLQATNQQCDNVGKAALGIIAIILIPLLILGLVFFIWWIFMVIHVAKHEDIKDRTVWLIVLLTALPLGLIWVAAPIYYFAVKRPYDKGGAREAPNVIPTQPPAPPNQPTESGQ